MLKYHRNIDFKKQSSSNTHHHTRKHHVNVTESYPHDQSNSSQDLVDLDNPTVMVESIKLSNICNFNQNNSNSNSPVSIFEIADNMKIEILWDTGSAITILDHSVVKHCKFPIDASKAVTYVDVNKNVASTLGTCKLKLFDDLVEFQVINNLARKAIFGWDIITRWQANIDIKNKQIYLTVKNKKYGIKFFTNTVNSISTLHKSSGATQEMQKLLTQYDHLMAKDNNKPSVTSLVKFSIDTGDSPPMYQAPRHFHPDIQVQIDVKLEQLCDSGVASMVTFTEWGSPVTVVSKPDGSIRICGNYVKLNSITNTYKYTFVNLHIALQSLGSAKIFSKIDLASGYYQIPIEESDKQKTTLVTTTASYQFNVMPFGLKNAPAFFQALMNKTLGSFRYKCAIAYLDDIIIYSTNEDTHAKDVDQVFQRLESANLLINKNKSAFGLNEIEFLGFIVTPLGVKANPEKIKPILSITAPTNLKELAIL